MNDCQHQLQTNNGNSLNQRMYKALLVFIFGVTLICVFESLLLLRSPQCYMQEGYYYPKAAEHRNIRKGPVLNSTSMKFLNFTAPEVISTSRTVQEAETTLLTTEGLTEKFDESEKIARYNVQHQRQRILREYCKKIERNQLNRSHNFNYRNPNILYSDKASLIYCYVPKVASTNWKRLFRVFNGQSKDPLEVKRKIKVHTFKYPSFKTLNKTSEIEWRKNVYYSFIFVRHPFVRIVSAYRNKLLDPYNSQYRRVYGSKVLRLFRKGLSKKEYQAGRNVTFEEFVDYIILIYEKFGSVALNEHWQVMNNLCDPCAMKYNFIGKMNSLIEDAQSVLNQIGWDKKVKFPANARDKYKTNAESLIKIYFSQLKRDSIDRLYKIYRPDFLAFGYPMDEY